MFFFLWWKFQLYLSCYFLPSSNLRMNNDCAFERMNICYYLKIWTFLLRSWKEHSSCSFSTLLRIIVSYFKNNSFPFLNSLLCLSWIDCVDCVFSSLMNLFSFHIITHSFVDCLLRFLQFFGYERNFKLGMKQFWWQRLGYLSIEGMTFFPSLITHELFVY